jgi:hypothetical protein
VYHNRHSLSGAAGREFSFIHHARVVTTPCAGGRSLKRVGTPSGGIEKIDADHPARAV